MLAFIKIAATIRVILQSRIGDIHRVTIPLRDSALRLPRDRIEVVDVTPN